MPQISLYIDETTLKKVESAAKNQHLSISKWVAKQIKEKIEPAYPNNYEKLFGSIDMDDIEDVKSIPFNEDYKREIL
jgi:hypothetical protein